MPKKKARRRRVNPKKWRAFRNALVGLLRDARNEGFEEGRQSIIDMFKKN
jgi:hypothetical protein